MAIVLATLGFAVCASAFTPLVDKRFSYPNGIPYKVDTDNLDRGQQFGYNRCNSTTQNQGSLCQTSFINSIDDFCLWAPPQPNSIVGNVEGEMVAWCTKPGRGTRVIPGGALHGVQFMRTPDYVQVVGFVDQTKIFLQANDDGGEMDPHGADLRGNPLGGLLYSTAWGGGFKQVIEWHNFLGGNTFCLKACDPAGRNAARFCEHIYDRIGCEFNAPNHARSGTFESCQGDNQDFPGVYVQNGVTHTYTQPPESLGPITSVPYVARVPASSKCAQFASSVIYAPGASVTIPDGNSPTTTTKTTEATSTSTSAAAPSTETSRTASATSQSASVTTDEMTTITSPPALGTVAGSVASIVVTQSTSTPTPQPLQPSGAARTVVVWGPISLGMLVSLLILL